MTRRPAPLPLLLAAAIVGLGAFGALPAAAAPVPVGASAARGQSHAHLTPVRSVHRPRTHRRHPRSKGALLVAPADHFAAAAPAPAPVAVPLAACPNADLIPAPTNLAAVATATLCLVNQSRARHGVAALAEDPRLDQAARVNNEDMIKDNYFSAGGRLGTTLRAGVRDAGFPVSLSTPYSAGENIAFGVLERATPRAVVDDWDSVPGYLANILDPSFTAFGIAVDASAPAILATGLGAATYTLDFSSP